MSIPPTFFKKINQRIKGTGFSSVSSYVTFVLREAVAEKTEDRHSGIFQEDEEKVKQRLRALGYLD